MMKCGKYKKLINLKVSQQLGLLVCVLSLFAQSVYAFEDCIITNKGKLTDISIEDNKIVDVYPFFSMGNERNTLYVHPLKEGKTRFCVLKNGKKIVMFNIEITEKKTTIGEVDGFEILAIDVPGVNKGVNGGVGVNNSEEFELDEPPILFESLRGGLDG